MIIVEVVHMFEEIKSKVNKLLENDNSGHDIEHIQRVLDLSLQFSNCENLYVNKEIVTLIALLHDVDDYKLFGEKNSKNLINAKKIMTSCQLNLSIIEKVCNGIYEIGYNKRLSGITPTTIEAQIVSDADMCDALGAHGILRTFQYSLNHHKVFFNKNIAPISNITADIYTNRCSDSSVCHFFEKLLKLKNMMLTKSGKNEAQIRHQFIVNFLYQYFKEENAYDWIEYLNQFLKNNSSQ